MLAFIPKIPVGIITYLQQTLGKQRTRPPEGYGHTGIDTGWAARTVFKVSIASGMPIILRHTASAVWNR